MAAEMAAEIVMTQWTIYGPANREHPGLYVVRAADIVRGMTGPVPREACTLHPTLAEARTAVPEYETYPRDGINWACYLTRIERAPNDDPCIVECWI